MLCQVVSHVKITKYFWISVDYTGYNTCGPTYFHPALYIPQRAVLKSVLKFLPIVSYTGEALFNSILRILQKLGIDIGNCHGQCYECWYVLHLQRSAGRVFCIIVFSNLVPTVTYLGVVMSRYKKFWNQMASAGIRKPAAVPFKNKGCHYESLKGFS